MEKVLPLDGLRVVEFTHMVMGPACGMILADLGANVIKVEPPGGDKTRFLLGSGAGYFPMYNRNKRSICLDVKSTDGHAAAMRLIRSADVFIENFRPGAMDKLGFGYDDLKVDHPRLIYCSEKGFLGGPYANRTALDEVAQMMSGMAYMTGPPGRPLRAGASVIDVQGGLFGALGILAAVQQRERTGKGMQVTASLFESAVFLMGQHMAQYAVTGEAPAPMPARVSAWAIYDVFSTANDKSVFVGVVTDGQWLSLCKTFDLGELTSDASLLTNKARVAARERILPVVAAAFGQYTDTELLQRLEAIGLPCAAINEPIAMLEDEHLLASGGLLDLTLTDSDRRGQSIKVPALPLQLGPDRQGVRYDLPGIGEHTEEVLTELEFDDTEIAALLKSGGLR